MPWSQQPSCLTLVHSHTLSETIYGKMSGLTILLRGRSHTPSELTHLVFLPLHLSKPFGKEKVFQQIEFPLRMLQSSHLVTDIHWSLIHNYKAKSGSRVEKAARWSPSNCHKEDGLRESKWLFQTVTFWWLNPLEKTLMPFLILFCRDNSSRKERDWRWDLDLRMLNWVPNSNFTFKLSLATLITSLKPQLNAQSSTSLSQKLVLRTNFWQVSSKLKNPTSSKKRKSL